MAKKKSSSPENPEEEKPKKSSENQENEENAAPDEADESLTEENNAEENAENSESSENSEGSEDPETQETPAEPVKPTEPEVLPPNIILQSITAEMEECYLDYSMSVIVARALPDVRDGMKPVHRRILYSMHELGLKHTAKFLKSARVVGDVLGKYHPHGDSAVYESLTRMAQDFAMRYMLINGQGNFGSIDGDSAAAMRYTECRMEKISAEMLADIDKETIPWNQNYDGTREEPSVLPAKIPQLLLNGTTGIAVGMATSIPPHNLGELIDGTIHLIENPEVTIEDLMEFIKGPDFPTGGIIYGREAIKEMYINGRGGIPIRARADIEEKKSGHFQIIVTEIPYQVNKSTLVSKIAELVQSKKIVGIKDIRDESNREGIRIVVELKKDSYPKKILNQLYKFTTMQTSFNMNMIALIDGLQPRLMNLKLVLEEFIKHRQVVVTKRTEFDLKVAKERAHILEGLKIALDHIDAVISTIKKSRTKEDAHVALMKKFKLTDVQASAILEMKLQTLAGLESQKIIDEYKEKLALIAKLEAILKNPAKILSIIKKELAEIKEKYADPRRTRINPHPIGEIGSKDYIPNEPMLIMLTRENYIKRMPPTTFRSQIRGGKGIIGGTTKAEDEIYLTKHALNHDEIYFFTNKGRVFRLPVFEIPQATRTAKGQAIVNLLQLGEGEKVMTMLVAENGKLLSKALIMATRKGTIKKTPTKDFLNVRRSGLIAIRLRPDDSLEWVKEVNPEENVIMVTRNGQSIRFDEKDARPMGRPSMGVRGIKLKPGDEVVEMDILRNNQGKVFVIMENGLGKRSNIAYYRLQNRGGSGIKTAKITAKTGKIVQARVLDNEIEGDLLIVSRHGQTIRMNIKSIPTTGRSTQGVYLMRMKANDKVGTMSIIASPKKEEEKLEELAQAKEESLQEDLKKVPVGVRLRTLPEKKEEVEEKDEKPKTKEAKPAAKPTPKAKTPTKAKPATKPAAKPKPTPKAEKAPAKKKPAAKKPVKPAPKKPAIKKAPPKKKAAKKPAPKKKPIPKKKPPKKTVPKKKAPAKKTPAKKSAKPVQTNLFSRRRIR